jgi:hypothetical protein
MRHSRETLRERYRFGDYLYYTTLLAVPLLTALVAIGGQSVRWAAAYLVLTAGLAALVLKFYCSRCPHYARDTSTLTCAFFWGLPKVFAARPGPLEPVDKAVALGAPAVLVLFPVYWLIQVPGLLIVYLLSLAGLAASVRRNECDRCVYFECPANKVPDARKNLKNY